jgi:hypothetical protein
MADPSGDSDALAETAAAPPSSPGVANAAAVDTATRAPSEPRVPPGGPATPPATIGGYQVQGELGMGAMGMVYAAYDPDLERRVAVKVLRPGGSGAANARLLREARAMARLSHPNVVTVHQVGTDGGIDFVAMELIDGSTLAEWLGAARRSPVEILDAFDAAGRGLAAAHAAGLVHRDFKPHNVLRAKSGRVVVTDFGLARAALEEPSPRASTAPDHPDRGADASAGSLSSTLTQTGAVLGTPAYMAPEQHDGATVGASADQFSFGVALWEALAGARPFPGHTLAAVRVQIDRGPDPESEARIPRRLRAPLRRALAVDPAERFPSMDALLVALRRRPGRQWAFALAAVVVAAAIGFVVLRGDEKAAPLVGCIGTPEQELAAVRSAPERAALAATPVGARLLAGIDAYASDWAGAQAKVCAAPAEPDHAKRVTCLVAARADLVRALTALGPLTPAELDASDVSMALNDPLACLAARPPHRVTIDDPAAVPLLRAGLMWGSSHPELPPDPGPEKPCLRVHYLMAKAADWTDNAATANRAVLTEAAEAADRCGDDALVAGVTIAGVSTDMASYLRDPTVARRVNAAVERSGGDRFMRVLEQLLAAVMTRLRGEIDLAIEQMTDALDDATAIGSRSFIAQCALSAGVWILDRRAPGDAEKADAILQRGIDLGVSRQRRELQIQRYYALEHGGRHAEAVAYAATVMQPDERPVAGGFEVKGRLVDEAGAPVAGARVVAGGRILVWPDALHPIAPVARTAITAADGTFAIANVQPKSAVMAVSSGRHARPVVAAPRVELALVPTGSVRGTVAVAGPDVGRVDIVVSFPPPLDIVSFVGEVGADGTWQIDGVPRGRLMAAIAYGAGNRSYRQIAFTLGEKPAGPIAFTATTAGEAVNVIVRPQVDQELSIGVTFAISGEVTVKTLRELDGMEAELSRVQAYPLAPASATGPIAGALRHGDLVSRFPFLVRGKTTFCSLATSGDISDQDYMERFERYGADLPVGCATVDITSAEQVVVVEVPPLKRLPE